MPPKPTKPKPAGPPSRVTPHTLEIERESPPKQSLPALTALRLKLPSPTFKAYPLSPFSPYAPWRRQGQAQGGEGAESMGGRRRSVIRLFGEVIATPPLPTLTDIPFFLPFYVLLFYILGHEVIINIVGYVLIIGVTLWLSWVVYSTLKIGFMVLGEQL